MTKNSAGAGKVSTVLIAALLVALVLFAGKYFPALTPNPSERLSGPESRSHSEVYFGPRNSLAVLPFEGEASVQDLAFWPEGFSSELQRLLIRTSGLRVTSRNSSYFFRGKAVAQVVVAERLQVRHLLTGEFLSANGRVSMSARLYDAKKDRELWSQTYEKDLGDVFTLQDEILASIAKAMNLNSGEELPRAIPVDTNAWAYYLRGLYYGDLRTPDGIQMAEEAFQSALQIEPGYALAKVRLAELWLRRQAAGEADPGLVNRARDMLQEVLNSVPDFADAYGLLSYIQRNFDWNWGGALESAGQALQMSGGDPELMSIASLAMFTLGQFDQASELLDASVRQDPLNLSRRLRLGLLHEFAGEYDLSLSSYRQIFGLNPDYPAARAYRSRVKIIQEKPESALKESEQESDSFWRRYSRILSLTALKRSEEAGLLLGRMIEEDGHQAAYQVAEILAFQGDIDAAFDWLDRAYQQKDGGMKELIGNYFLRNLHDDPRWNEMLNLLGLPLDSAR